MLGAGGPVGKAWQSGLIGGLIARKIDLADASLIIGTSNGAIVGAQLALGLPFTAPARLDLAVPALSVSSFRGLSELLPAIARAARSPQPEIERARIGAFALAAQTVNERDSIARTALAGIPGRAWPPQFRAAAVNAHTGKLRVWDASSGAPLERAVAASAAFPGIWPPVTINGEQYIDGSVRSMLNADVATGCATVIVVSCFALEAAGPMADPDWAVTIGAQVAELRALRDAMVVLVTPSEAFLALTHHGASMMDGNLAADAFRIGWAQAVQAAETVRSTWNS